METRKIYFRWQVVAVLWLMMAFSVSLVYGQEKEKESAQQTDSTTKRGGGTGRIRLCL